MAHQEWTTGMGRADSLGRTIRQGIKEIQGFLVRLVRVGSK